VRKLLANAGRHGAGRRYLIQHSAGSGKSNSIAWLAHQLIGLSREEQAVFDSILVVTDVPGTSPPAVSGAGFVLRHGFLGEGSSEPGAGASPSGTRERRNKCLAPASEVRRFYANGLAWERSCVLRWMRPHILVNQGR
jgi:hypothetical protein